MQYFTFSFVFALLGILATYYWLGFEAAYIVILLALLEISISFDNAIINAKVLENMDKVWRRRFIVYGIPIAVFGVRFVLPILIVAIASGIGGIEILKLAIYEPKEYATHLNEVMAQIYAFGGAFLLMVFLEFFFDCDREVFWLKPLENNFFTKTLSRYKMSGFICALMIGIILYFIAQYLQPLKTLVIIISFFIGIALYMAIRSIDFALARTGIKSGVLGFLYLEILDASFSLDGVIGAFALSNNVFVIVLGLAIGAFFVRSLTVYFVEKKLLSQFIYLEHGARWAILILALLMFAQIFTHLGEAIVGSVGIIIIACAFLHSLWHNRRTKTEE